MRLPWRRHKDHETSDEARAHYERAVEVEDQAHRIVTHERWLIRDNNFSPKVKRALGKEAG